MFKGTNRVYARSVALIVGGLSWLLVVGAHAAIVVGTAPGQFSVSRTGAATYQIPLDLPPGVNGLKPNLALLYNSQAGNGLLGEGWSLTGLSVINRCPQTLDQDNAIHIPDGTSADRFCLDGQRLILTSGSWGAASSVYHTEIESFQQVTLSGSATSSGSFFTVVDRSGLTRTYSTIPLSTGSGAPLEWLVTKITDHYNNFISFQYHTGTYIGVQEIDYGSAAGTVGKTIFSYTGGRGDAYSQFAGATGVLTSLNGAELTTIAVENGGGTVLRTYTLGYSAPTAFPMPPTTLASVTECAGDGTCFAPTSFTYSGATNNFADLNYLGNGTPIQQANLQTLDLDGDGLPDYIYAANSTVYVIFGDNPGTAVATPVPWGTSSQAGIGLQGAVVVDLNGDGKQELLVPYYPSSTSVPTWYELKWNGQSGSGANLTWGAVPTTTGGAIPACTSNGCIPSAVAVNPSGNGQTGLLFATNGGLYYYPNSSGSLSGSYSWTGSYSGSFPNLLAPVNYDGQAASEVYVAGNGVLKSNSSGGFSWVTTGNFGESNGYSVRFVNADGSGLSSAVVMTSSNWWFCPNTGQGFPFLSSQNCTESAGALSGQDLTQAQAVDYYGDGRQEILVPDTSSSTWYLFNDFNSADPVFTNLDTSQVPYKGVTEFIDVNGDGRLDMLVPSSGEYYLNTASPYLLNEVINGLGHHTDIGYIPIDQATHSNYVAGPPSPVIHAPNIRAYMGPMYVVDDYAVDTGLSNSNGSEQIYTYYIYAGAALDQWGRGFLGFSEVEAINYNTGLYTKDTYDQSFPYTGMVTSSSKFYDLSLAHDTPPPHVTASGAKVTCTYANPAEPNCVVTYTSSPPPASFTSSGTPISSTSNTFACLQPYSSQYTCQQPPSGVGVYFPYVHISTTQLYELGANNPYETTMTTSTYQTVGSGTPIGVDVMPTDINVNTTATAGTTTTTAIVDTQTGYGQESTCPGHATSISVTDTYNGTPAPAKTEGFVYDGNCFLTNDTKTIVSSGGNLTLTKAYAPDGYGNVASSTVSGTGISPARTTTMSYDPTERFPVAITNALGQTEGLSYNDYGEKLTDTDANGDTLTYAYYGLGQKKEVLGPQPAVHTNWSYSFCSACVANAIYTVTQTSSDGSEVIGQYDQLGRELESERLGFAGEWVIQDTQYDLLGRIAQVSTPYTSPAKSGQVICQDVKIYDVLNRITLDTQPHAVQSGSCVTRNVSYGYNGLQTTKTISAQGTSIGSEQIITTLNALGKPAQVNDTQSDGSGGITSYGYDPWGDVTSVTPPDGNTVSMTYDSASDKLTMHDPDMGAWSYTYDALGELLTQTDAKNQTVSNSYDALGRLVSRTEPEGTTLWKYDIAYGAGIGRLAYKAGPNGVWEGFAYDAYGHPTDKITVVNGQEYWVTTTYNAQGRVSQLVYPNLTGINVNGTPTTPTGLQVAVDASNNAQFDVSWTAQQNGEIYHLYRTVSTASSPTDADEIYSGPNANWPDDGITANGSYKWWLKACNDTNCSGYVTTTLTVTLPPTVPGAPQVPASDSHASSIPLSWVGSNLVSNTAGPISYEVLESYAPPNGQAGAFTQVATSGSTSTNVSLLQDGTYVFAVSACASGACSAAGDSSTGYQTYLQPSTPTSISAPSTVEPTSSPATYTVSWPASTFSGGSVNYVLQEEIGTGGFAQVYSGSGLSYLVSKTQDGKYSYRVQACDGNTTGVCSGFTSPTTVAVTLPPTNPGAPTPPSSDQHSASWNVTWAPSTLNSGSSGSISYELDQSYNGGGFSAVSGTPTNISGTMYLIAQAVLSGGYYQNGSYTYELRACTTDPNTEGTACTSYINSGAYSTTIVPGVPTSLSVPSQSNWDGSFTVSYGAPAANSGGPVTAYHVQLGEYDGGSNTYFWIDGNCSSSTTFCTFGAGQITPGSYLVRMDAEDGSVAGAWTPASAPYPSVTVWHLAPPAAPTLSGPSTVDIDSVGLSWSAPSTATSYQLYGSYDTSTGWSAYSQRYSGANRSYTDTFGARVTQVRYYVIACNQAGCSGDSNVLTVTVQLQGGCKTCSPTNGATTAPTQSTGTPPTPAPSASSGGGSLADVELPAFAPAAPISLDQQPTFTALMTLSTSPAPPVAQIEPVAVHQAPQAARAIASVVSAREVFFLAHAGESSQSTKPLVRRGGDMRITDPRRDILRTRSSSELVARNGLLSSFEKGRLESISASLIQSGWHYVPAVDPQLSEYPPLRRDPRVEAHFESLGGQLPGVARQADCGGSDSDKDCSQPTGGTALMVGYAYNGQGYLAQVLKLDSGGNPVRVLWQATDETALGQVDNECFDEPQPIPLTQYTCSSPTLSVSNTYDQASGVLDSTTAAASVAGDTVDASYAWDGYNNLCSRSVSETVGSGTAPPTLDESFGYDPLNRLTDIATGTGTCSSGSTIVYNAVGRFEQNGGYTNYQYSNPGYTVSGYTYSQPHAVSSVTTPAGVTRTFTYDANGNLLTESGDVSRAVSWTSYNKPSQIIGNGVTETFVYGPDRSRLVTAITKGSDTVTTTYIDGLFEQVYDSSTGNLTYRHYILAGGARVGVETINANSGGTITSDTLSFYVRDEVGSVIATVTESLGGANQAVALTSYDAWGKARPTSGSTAYQDPAPGTFYSPTPAGQEEGFAGHDNLMDTGLVDMEGRVYDPEVGTFLSADPNVQYPFSSQGYDRYIYVNDNPLSLSDPSGYFSGEQAVGLAAAIVMSIYGNEEGWAWYDTAFASGAVGGYLSSGGNLQTGVESGLEAVAFSYVGDQVGWGNTVGDQLAKSVTEGVIGGLFTEAGGGNFGDGFIGAFTSSELSPVIGSIGGDPNVNAAVYYSAANIAARVVVSAVVGGTVASMTGGNFSEAAEAAAFQRLFNEENSYKAQQAALREDLENYLNDPRTQAMLMTIASGEGPGYNVEYGGKTFNDFSTYPDGAIAAGAYQIQPKTWEWLSSVLGTSDFSPHTQDLMATYLLKSSGALNQLFKGNFDQAIFKASRWWSSLPADYSGQSYYPQYMNHVTPLPILEDIYHFELTTLTWDF